MTGRPLLEVEDLRVSFATEQGRVQAVDGVSFAVEPGRTLGIVGESGSGKSVTSMAVMGLLKSGRAQVSGRVTFDGRDLLGAAPRERRLVRGDDMAMIFQDPLSSLHPMRRVGWQIVEAIRAHRDVSAATARARAIELLEMVGIGQAASRLDAFPHQFSGGMRQRVMIAMALANEPRLLIADEPTTALDVTVQSQILVLLRRLQDELGMAIVFITHDLGVVAQTAHDVAVMYAGRVVERAPTAELFRAPSHPYTWGLLGSVPRLDGPRGGQLVPIAGRPPSLLALPDGCRFAPRCPHVRADCRTVDPLLMALNDRPEHASACLLHEAERARVWDGLRAATPVAPAPVAPAADVAPGQPLVEVRDVVKHFGGGGGLLARRRPPVRAVDGVSFDVLAGETLGVVGESGCGKSTTARLLTALLDPTAGSVRFAGTEVGALRGRELQRFRREVQMIFQDPFGSLNSRKTAGAIIAEPLVVHGLMPDRARRRARVLELMEQVGLAPEHADRRPDEFSGGQRQRIGIARALALNPKLIVADEPVSALDVSVQAQILNLLRDLQRDLGLTLVLIAHDLSVVRHMCDRIVVMYLGQAVEVADADTLYDNPAHPYTRALLSAVPVPDPDRPGTARPLGGDPPSPVGPPAGCRFHPRCAYAQDVCRAEAPALGPVTSGALAACHFPQDQEVPDAARR